MNIYNIYAEKGWKTIRVAGPEQGGKRPLDKAWTDMPATLPEDGENCGIQTGEVSGFIVLDVDGPEGAESLATYESQHGALPEGPRQVTGSGGAHILFKYPEQKLGNRVKFMPGLDVRSDGGQIVVEPSVHKNGNTYRWTGLETAVPLIPKSLLTLMGAEPVIVTTRCPKSWTKWLATQPPMVAGSGANNVFMSALGVGIREHNVNDVDQAWLAFSAYNKRATNDKDQPYPWSKREFTRAWNKIHDEYVESPQSRVELKENWTQLQKLSAILTQDPVFVGRCALNALTQVIEVDGKPISEHAITTLTLALLDRYGALICLRGEVSPSTLGRLVDKTAREFSYDPLQDWLNGLKWDGQSRVDRLAKRSLGVAEDISQVVVRNWLLGCIARAMVPGCKFDNVLTLQGAQGAGKSSFFRILGGKYFSDSTINVGSKDAYQNIANKWIWEWAELETVWGKANQSKVKAFLTSSVDTYRPSYGRYNVTVPRRCVFAATTNLSDFVSDPTGARRFWCIAIPQRVDIAYLSENREQLWAECVHLYKTLGEDCWVLTEEQADQQAAITAAFSQEDVIAEVIEEFIEGQDRVRLADVMTEANLRLNNKADTSLATNCLRHQGFISAKIRVNGVQGRYWVRSQSE